MSKIIVDLDEARRDLAAVFRWTARESMHEGIANHFSMLSRMMAVFNESIWGAFLADES